VVVKDRETMVLGGLFRANVTTSEDKVPFLGDIPLLGWLFKFKTTKVEKVNLMLFITPYIINNEQDAQEITKSKAEALEQFRDKYRIEKKEMGGLVETKKPGTATQEAVTSGVSTTQQPAGSQSLAPEGAAVTAPTPTEGAR